MAFGKIVLGIFLAGLGGLLLAGTLGYLPAGVWPWLLKFWPFILLALGIALLANRLRNIALGMIAVTLVIGCLVFGAFWISRYSSAAKTEHRTQIDLTKPPVRTVTIEGRTIGGWLELSADPRAKHALRLEVRGVSGAELAAPHWRASQGAGLLRWPARAEITEPGLVGGTIRVGAPPRTPVSLGWQSALSSANIDLANLSPDQCDVNAIGAAVVFRVGSALPRRIRVHGTFSNAEIHLPARCPVRVDLYSSLNLHSFPDDFVERVSMGPKGKAVYWMAEGPGRPIQILLDGPFMRLRIVRDPVRAL
jgi:hypothetical protein